MLSTYTMPFDGSAAVQPQFAPPCAPGIDTVSFSAGGVNSPSLRAFAMRVFHVSRSLGRQDVRVDVVGRQPLRRERRRRRRKRLRRPRRSPGISLDGTRRSSIGHIGSPVTRSNTYRKPVLPAWATTSIVLAVAPDGRELRRRRVVVVPQIVVHHLEVPQPFSGARVQRQQRRAEQIGAVPIGAVEVVGRRSERKVGDASAPDRR